MFQVRLEDHRGEDYKATAPKFKAFGGAGHMLGSPAPNVTSSTLSQNASAKAHMTATTAGSQSAPIDTARLEQIAEQRFKSSSSATNLRLRLPEISTPLRIAIDLNRTLADVRQFLSENVPSLQSNQFEFIEPPSTKLKRDDEIKTLSDAKLINATLAIRRMT
jgi:UBX domain-containing protein 1